MYRTLPILFALALLLTSCPPGPGEPEPEYDKALTSACDYIRGGGVGTTGGEGGDVYYVTKLKDEFDANKKPAAGTLRYAIEEMSSRRVILFRVSGTIYLERPLNLRHGNVTIAGQSAPGDGICVANYPLIISGSNVIVRFMRFRLGDQMKTEDDALSVNDATNVVLDHLSCSWSVDECVSCYGNENFTMQYCLISESLKNSVHGKGNHGYGGIWGGKNASFHHNLLAHHDSRNPRFDHDYVNTMAGPIDFINNVVYNWGGNSAYGGEGSSKSGGGRKINFVNNYYKPGPATKTKTRLMQAWASCDNCKNKYGGSIVPPHLYLAGNYMDKSEDVTNNNWKGVNYSGGATEAMCKVTTRYTFPGCVTGEQTAVEAYETVLENVGCCLHRDKLDEVILNDVRTTSYTHRGSNGSTGGLIDTPSDAGGYPDLKQTLVPQDTDRDGMPDDWELAHNLDPNNFKDGVLHTLVKDHTNLEAYLCELVAHLYEK